MADLTDDPNDIRLTRGINDTPVPQADAYLVLSDNDRARGFIRPVRTSYVHTTCGAVTTMSRALAETYVAQPNFYDATYCAHCLMHRPVAEFTWDADGTLVGS